MSRDNLALHLCAKLQLIIRPDISPKEWRLVGQEQDCTQLFTWIFTSELNCEVTGIGSYSQATKEFQVLHIFKNKLNIIQASVNDTQTVLCYTVKQIIPSFKIGEESDSFYKTFILYLNSRDKLEPLLIENDKKKQTMVQFLYKEKKSPIEKNIIDRIILLTHLECVKLYTLKLIYDESSKTHITVWCVDNILSSPDIIVKSFCWAQWDPVHQVLYYIHYRLPVQSSIETSDSKTQSDMTPTLSGLQFHTDLPHETVLNIPLNLPQLPSSNELFPCEVYEDDAVPLRIHDCSLDLQIVSHPSGIVCICHHYLYQPIDDSDASEPSNKFERPRDFTNKINFAYSVTLLHHGYVTHCVLPNVEWTLAKMLRPMFSLYKEDYLLVHLPTFFTHLLDIGLNHEPCNHIVLPPSANIQGDRLIPLLGRGKNILIDLSTLDVLKVNIPSAQLITIFKSDTELENKLAILHYFLHHDIDIQIVEELLCEICNRPGNMISMLSNILKEFLISGSYITTKSSLSSSALPLTRLIPFTTNSKPSTIKVGSIELQVSQEQLWNTAMMLLSPRQRIAPFRTDMWTRLWDYLSPITMRFKPHQVLEKLRVSLACYQPEALSRCSTPLSPAGPPPSSRRIAPTFSLQSNQSADPNLLPFIELDTCTASKQEHIISVNLREISMHLLKHGSATGAGQGVQGSAGHVHAVATRYAAAQLETSRALCLIICKALLATAKSDQERGFAFIKSMNDDHRFMLLKALEYYYLAADSIAFPLPQGFSSFFTYLGYCTLSYSNFLQYIHRNVFEVQIDFLKTIITEAGEDNEGVLRAIRLAALGGRGRGKRALVNCSHPTALLLRARDHAATILAGQPANLTRPASSSRITSTRRGIAAFPSGGRLSPLDTFLDLLTAKASLNELDFNLLIAATILAET